jgi:WD40 repeat protein
LDHEFKVGMDDRKLSVGASILMTSSGNPMRSVDLWDVNGGSLLRSVGDRRDNEHAAFSPDGNTIASWVFTTVQAPRVRLSAQVWNAQTGERAVSLEEPPGNLQFNDVGGPLRFCPNGRHVVMVLAHSRGGPSKGNLLLWDAISGKFRGYLQPPTTTFADGSASTVQAAFSPDSQTIATLESDGRSAEVWLWTLSTLAPRRITQGEISNLAFTPDGKQLAIVTRRGELQIWESATGRQRALLRGTPKQTVHQSSFAHDGKTLASTGGNYAAVWRLPSGRLQVALPGHPWPQLRGSVLAPDAKTLFVSNYLAGIQRWDPLNGAAKGVPLPDPFSGIGPDGGGTVTRCVTTPGGPRLVVRGSSGGVALLDPETGAILSRLDRSDWLSANGAVTAAATAGRDAVTITLWDALENRQMSSFSVTHQSLMWCDLCLAPDGALLAFSESESGHIRVRDSHSAALISTLQNTKNEYPVAFSPDEQIIATIFRPEGPYPVWHGIRLYDTHTGHLLRTLDSAGGIIQGADFVGPNSGAFVEETRDTLFSPDGMTVMTTGDRSIQLWDSGSAALRLSTPDYGGAEARAFSNDSSVFAVRNQLGMVKMWDALTGKPLVVTRANLSRLPASFEYPNYMLAFTNPRTGEVLATLRYLPPVENGESEWIIYTPDGYFRASPHADRYVRWKLGDTRYPAAKFWKQFSRPDLVQKALRWDAADPAAARPSS